MENTSKKSFHEFLEEELKKTRESLAESVKATEIERIKAMDTEEFQKYISLDAAYIMKFNVNVVGSDISLESGPAYWAIEELYEKEEKERIDKLFKEELPDFISERMTAILGEENIKIIRVKGEDD